MELLEQILRRDRPGLLVSVRSADEARAALAGGADVIDVKEPDRGPLGAADRNTIVDVVRAVKGRVPVTAAAGELLDLVPLLDGGNIQPLPAGVSLVKIGLSQCADLRHWQSYWRRAINAHQIENDRQHALPVAVVYADWHAANSPRPQQIHTAALNVDCRVVLIDTWDKSVGTLFDSWPADELKSYVKRIQRGGQSAVVLAGSLSGANLLAAAELRPQLVAVRGAACDSGRRGAVSQHRTTDLRQLLNSIDVSADWQAAKSTMLPN